MDATGGILEEVPVKPWARAFYMSAQWKACRNSYIKSVGGLCERCWERGQVRPASIVHHKVYITPENIRDPNITLNYANLEALCRECHEAEHRHGPKRYAVDAMGRVTATR